MQRAYAGTEWVLRGWIECREVERVDSLRTDPCPAHNRSHVLTTRRRHPNVNASAARQFDARVSGLNRQTPGFMRSSLRNLYMRDSTNSRPILPLHHPLRQKCCFSSQGHGASTTQPSPVSKNNSFDEDQARPILLTVCDKTLC